MAETLVSIIIPIKDELMVTTMCLDSILAYTKNFELILINDGSSQDTSKFLLNFAQKPANLPQTKLITHNNIPLGWVKSINDGLKEAKGDFICFLNNDVVVSPGWLEKMLKHFAVDKELGALGPTTNRVEGYQHIDYNREGVDFQYTDVLTGFCILLRKEVVDKIGGLDTCFGFGGQDDSDYMIRTRQAGYKVGIARDVFLYHYGSASFRTLFKHNIPISKTYAQSKIDQLRDKYRDEVDSGVRKRVFIAIPNQEAIVPDLVNVLLWWTHDPRFVIRIYMPKNIFPLDAARNHCVKEFLELDYDYLFFIDSDITPPVDTLEKFIRANKDAIGATCFAMKYEGDEAFPYPVTLRYNEEKQYIAYYGQGIEEVDATGGACVLVKRKVYEALERPYEFHYHRNGTLSLTCDFDIWQKFQAKGFHLFVDFDIICSHMKEVDLKAINNLLVRISREDINKQKIMIE